MFRGRSCSVSSSSLDNEVSALSVALLFGVDIVVELSEFVDVLFVPLPNATLLCGHLQWLLRSLGGHFACYDAVYRLRRVAGQVWVLQGDIYGFGIGSLRRCWISGTDPFKSIFVHSF